MVFNQAFSNTEILAKLLMPLNKLASRFFPHLITLLIGGLMLSGCQTKEFNHPVTQIFPLEGEQVSAWGWIGVEFSQPMNTRSVEKAFSLSPDREGTFFWDENTFWFIPISAFDRENSTQAQLSGTLRTADGQALAIDLTWKFTVREPSIIFYRPEADFGEIWYADADGSNPQQLSMTNGNVIEFAPDRTGAQIAFTVHNEVDGHDVWIMDRDGAEQRLLVNCNQDNCGEPAWSIDRTRIAYTREVYDPDTQGYQPAQVWTVDTQTGDTSQLYQSDVAFGHSPSFSPDGIHLATYDTTHNGIRILDLTTSQEEVVPRILPGSGNWSLDGSRLLLTDVVPAENEPFVEIYLLDLESNALTPAFAEPITDTDFSQPRWSPDDEWIAVSLRPVNTGISKALWVISLSDAESILIADEPSATFSGYRWDPWGERLVYQRFILGSSEPDTSIWLWDWKSGESTLIFENGARPQWLP